MKLDDRARRAAEDIHRSVGAPEGIAPSGAEAIERFHRFGRLKQRNQRIGAVILAAVLSVAAIAFVTRAFGPSQRKSPAAPTPSGGLILYGEWNPKLQQAHWFTVHPDGSGVQDLHLVATCADWFPDGSKILITDDAAVAPGSPLRPATINPDGSGLRRLGGTPEPNLNLGCGDVSPHGTRLVLEGFNEHRSGFSGLYMVRSSDGGGLVRLTRGSDASPQFSPDGRQVVFLRNKAGVSTEGAGALFVVDTDGTGLRQITPWGFAFLGYSWSPDGLWIVFQRPYGQLYLVHPDGTGLHRVPVQLPAGSGAQNPAWSPDGTRIVFSLERNGHANIYTVLADGTGLRQVTRSTGVEEQSPDWGRHAG